MKLLLLGCTGFIGKELIPKLINSGHELTIVSRKKSNTFNIKLKGKGIHYHQLDLSSLKSWENNQFLESISNSEGIINLVGEPIAEKRWTKKHCQDIECISRCISGYISKSISR